MMTVIRRIIIIMTAWLRGTQSSQGECEEEGGWERAVAVLSSSTAMIMSEMPRIRAPAARQVKIATLSTMSAAEHHLRPCCRTGDGTTTAYRRARTRRRQRRE
jgi:hypothetical protein